MTDKEFIKYHKDFCDKMHEVVKNKNHDYSGFQESAFANFELVEKMGIASVEQGFLTRITDKIARLNSFIKQGTTKVADEKIEDTLMDLANYSILLAGYLKSKKELNDEIIDRWKSYEGTITFSKHWEDWENGNY